MTRQLTSISCPACEGEGVRLTLGGPGGYSGRAGTYLPDEAFVACPLCDGDGEVEACTRCRHPLELVAGREVCGCVQLQEAA